MKKVFVLGSINLDYVISVSSLPLIGESKNGHGFMTNQGGKGANQAIACKKLGCENVSLIASVGNDQNGKTLIDAVSSYGVDTSHMIIKNGINSGCCVIVLDESVNDNILIIDRGANDKVEPSDFIDYLRDNAKPGDILITQLEINLDAIYKGLEVAKEIGMYTILNPAPVTKIDNNVLKYVDLIVPNETECKLFTDISVKTREDAVNAFNWFNKFGVKEMVITLGSLGSYYLNKDEALHFDIRKVCAVDTTGAGDTFIGALAYRMASGYSIKESMDYAAVCSSITVSRKGAGVSIPTKAEVDEVINSIK